MLFFNYSSTGQSNNWRTAALKEEANYFEIVNSTRQELDLLRGRTDIESKKKIKQFERWASLWRNRIKPDGSFVSPYHDYSEWLKDNARQAQLPDHVRSSTEWSLIGPTTIPISTFLAPNYSGMGRVNCIAFNGTNVNTLYIGTPSGGIWKTTDGGNTWIPKGDNFPNMGVSDIVINPSNPNVLYLATGDFDAQHNFSIGVLKSTDAGDTWNTTGLTFNVTEMNTIGNLLIDPNNTETIFATTTNSIKRSTDGGANWADVFVESNANFNDIQYKTGSNTIIYATSNSGKFYISTNNGVSWTTASAPTTSGRLEIAQTSNDPDLILSVDQSGVVRKSTNQGSSWATVHTFTMFNSQGGYNLTIAISPINKNLIFVGDINGWRSQNGGSTWEAYLNGFWQTGDPYFYVHADHHDFVFVSGTNMAFSGNDGGIYKGDASSSTAWTDLSSGLAITQFYHVSGTPQDEGKLILGAQDNDAAVYNGTSFTSVGVGDGVAGLWDYSNSNIAWACGQHGLLKRTTDGFASEPEILNVPMVPTPFTWELEIHPTVPTTIFGGFNEIYKSTNRGDSWTNMNSGTGIPISIALAPSDGNIIYVYGLNGLKKTTNGGASWTTLPNPQDFTITGIAIHPTNPNEVYICYGGYLSAHVYKSTDGGISWQNISGSLPNIPAYDIDYRTGTTDGELFLATHFGVYYWRNSNADWVKLDNGLPNVIVRDINIFYSTEKIRVATFGRGSWEASISSAALGVEENALSEDAVSLFPNPTNNKSFNIKLNNLTGKSSVLIYNIIGSVVKHFETSNDLNNVDLSNFSEGIYLVQITNNNQSITKKIIVK